MTEDIVRDLRNLSKGVELQENMLYELIPLYRVRFAQPAFDHVKLMEQKAKYMEGYKIILCICIYYKTEIL